MKTKRQSISAFLNGRAVSIAVCGLVAGWFVFGAFAAAAQSCPRATVKFSEISYDPLAGQPQWVELINTGNQSVDVRGMEIVAGTNAYSLPITLSEMPTNGLILIYFDGGGTDVTSFAVANLATLHSSTTNFLGNPIGSAALYQVTGIHTSDTMVDYVAWGGPAGADAAFAVAKNILSDTNSYIPTDPDPDFAPKGPFYPMPVGGALDFVNGAWAVYDPTSTTPGAPNALIAQPYITDPGDGEWSDGGPAWFRWVLQPGADHYELQVATDNSFASLTWDVTNLVTTTYIPGTNALPLGTNWCRLRSFSTNGASSQWSVPVWFQVGIPVVTPPVDPAPSIEPQKMGAANPKTAALNTIQGRVVDTRTHNGLVGVSVVLQSGAAIVASTVSDAFGRFTLAATNGNYSIVCTLANYSNIPVTPLNVTASVAGLTINATGDSGTLPTPLKQYLGAKKDTPLLEVRNYGGWMCEKTATARDQAWDQPHTTYHPNANELESWYCWAITTTMIARHTGGTLYVDEVVNNVKNMGFEKDASATDADMKKALKFALQTADANLNYTRTKFTTAQVVNAITNDRPIAYSTPVHWMTIDGFQFEDERLKCHFVNIDNMANATNRDFLNEPWDSGFIPNSGLAGLATDPRVFLHSDGDANGVCDFDKDTRFNCSKATTDTDGDGIPDKIEIGSWAFARDGSGGNIAGKAFAPAWGKKAQYTADTDGGGVNDGDEDKNHNGISGKWDTANPGETDVFDPSDDKTRLDLVFCIDTTGSMTPYISGVENSLISIINSLSTNFPSYRVAIVGFKDYPDEDSAYLNYIYSPFTTNIANLTSSVFAAEGDVGGGGDTPEAVYSGIIRCITDPALGGWRTNATRVIITMGDAPAHNPEENGTTLATVQAAAASGGPIFYNSSPGLPGLVFSKGTARDALTVDTNILSGFISVYPVWEGSDPSAGVSWTNIALATGGSVVKAPSGSVVGTAILNQINTIKASTIASLNVTGPAGESNVRGLTNIVADASASYDPNGCGILQYEWDWNGDGSYDQTTFGPIVSHSYPAGFTGPVSVRITTVGGSTAVATFSLSVVSSSTLNVTSQTLNTNIDRQTGLFLQQIMIANTGASTVAGFEVSVTNLPPGVYFITATGTNAGVPFVDFNSPLAPGNSITLTLAYYSTNRSAPVGVGVSVKAITPGVVTVSTGTVLILDPPTLRASDANWTLDLFGTHGSTLPGRTYVIEYKDSLSGPWKQAQPAVTGTGSRVIWVDSGPPVTDSAPSSGRFYQVVLLP